MREVCHHYNNAKTDAHDAPPPAKRTGDHLVRALTEPPADELMKISDMEDLETVVIEAVCKLEFWLPATELDIKCHNLLHLAQKINSTGPVCWTSMWRYESMWGTFAKHARKKDSVGLTTLRRIEEEEALQLHALSNPDAYLLPNKTADIDGHNDLSDYWCPRALFQGRDSLLVPPVVDPRKKRDVPMDKIELQGIHAIFLELFEKYATLWVRFINSLHPELIQADGSVKITANQLKVIAHIENHSFRYMPRQPIHYFST